jgi:hypothetical protein
VTIKEVVYLALFIELPDKDKINFSEEEFHLVEQLQVLTLHSCLNPLFHQNKLQFLLSLAASHYSFAVEAQNLAF